MVQIKGLPILLACVYFVFSGFIDGLFFGATSKKVPHGTLTSLFLASSTDADLLFSVEGAWFPLGLACVLLLFLLFWAWAKGTSSFSTSDLPPQQD
jgi:KUP system potassium uptake protein